MMAYYNENDKKAAACLRELIKKGLIADGFVDDRSIIDVKANDLKGYSQHHFFAGIGGWSYALRLAGWADNRAVCTASLPCQPFSIAGKGKGNTDERHLLPHFLALVRECGFNTIFGEQVENSIKHGWTCDLQANLERENYTVGIAVLGAHSVGAYQKRQRLYWVANFCGVASTEITERGRNKNKGINGRRLTQVGGSSSWSDPDWIYCRDGKHRPIKRGLEPCIITLADGLSGRVVPCIDTSLPINADYTKEARVMRLKGYGNAIVPQVAAEFIKAFMAVSPC